MARVPALAAALALLLACNLEPGGRCAFDAQCRAGLECAAGLCVVRDTGADLGASCAIDSDCVSWGICRENVCVLEPGACVVNGDCPSWEACTTDHVCVLATGKCASNADCVSWKTCSLTSYTCALVSGRCDTTANCQPWQTCDSTTHRCESLDGTDVLLFGTLTKDDPATAGVSLVGDPAHPTVGLPSTAGAARLDGFGALVYRDGGSPQALRRLVADALTWDATAGVWKYPPTPSGNDVAIATPMCTGGTVDRFLTRPGTNEVLHSCDGSKWYDSASTLRFSEPAGADLVAWSASDAKLLVASSVYSVVDAVGVTHAVTGLPAATKIWMARTQGDGFWIALQDAASGDDELWSVSATGVAAAAGVYPALTVGPSANGVTALDSDGVAYTWTDQKVVSRAPNGVAGTVLYDATLATSVWTANPASWWLQASDPAILTGP